MTHIKTKSLREATDPLMRRPDVALYYLMDCFEEDRPDKGVHNAIQKVAKSLMLPVINRKADPSEMIKALRSVNKKSLSIAMMSSLMVEAGFAQPTLNIAPGQKNDLKHD